MHVVFLTTRTLLLIALKCKSWSNVYSVWAYLYRHKIFFYTAFCDRTWCTRDASCPFTLQLFSQRACPYFNELKCDV